MTESTGDRKDHTRHTAEQQSHTRTTNAHPHTHTHTHTHTHASTVLQY
jgi:hypothetical protein